MSLLTEGPGNQSDKNYYSEECLDDAVNVFEGARCYLNHQTDEEEEVRPEGDIKDQVGYFILVDTKGKAVNEDVLDLIAEPIEITGVVKKRGPLLYLFADPENFKRLK